MSSTTLFLLLLDQSISLLHAVAAGELLVPLIALGILLRPFLRTKIAHGLTGNAIPWDEHKVGEGDIVADEVRLPGLREVGVDHPQDTADLVGVAVNCRSEVLLRVELGEVSSIVDHRADERCTHEAKPGKLAEVGALTTHLEVFPAVLRIPLGECVVAELVLLVILIEQIFDNRTGLHMSAAVISLEGDESALVRRTSHKVISVFGSWIEGKRPFGLTLVYGSCFNTLKSMYSDSYGTSISSRMMSTFSGFGP